MRVPFRRAAMVAMVALTACAPSAPTAAPAQPQQPAEQREERQVLNVAAGSTTANMTPQAAGGHWIRWHMYDTLTQFGPQFEVRPSVASQWQLSADGTTWTFTIRSDMTFSNGDRLTAEDVAFSFQQAFERNWPARANFASVIPESVRAVNATTVELRTRVADVTILNNTPFLWVIPKAYFERVGWEGFLARPIGSTPYELVEFRQDTLVTFRKRSAPHPFRQAQNDEINFRVIVEPAQVINGLRTGEIDIATVYVFTNDQLDQLQRANATVNFFRISALAMSFPEGAQQGRNSPLADRRVRQALNYAVNRQAIASLFREAQPLGQYAIPDSPFFDPAAPAIPFDQAQARRLLAEAGYPNGFRLSTPIEFGAATFRQEVMLALQADFRAIGVEAELAPLDFVTAADKTAGRNNQVKSEVFATVGGDANGFVTGVRANFGCGRPLGSPPNAVFFCNAEFDRLMDQAYQERDAARRAQLFRQANAVLRQEAVLLPIIVQPSHSAFSNKIRGVQMPYFFYFTLDSAYKVK